MQMLCPDLGWSALGRMWALRFVVSTKSPRPDVGAVLPVPSIHAYFPGVPEVVPQCLGNSKVAESA